MAFCSNCGTRLPEGAAFCNGCGATQQQQAPAAPQMQQQAAAPQMQPQQPYMQQQPFAAQPQYAAQQPAQKSRTPLIAGLAAGGTALVAGIVVLILFLTGVIGGDPSPVKDPVPIANSGETGTGDGFENAMIIGTDIPLQEITSYSSGWYNGLGRCGAGRTVEKTAQGARYTIYEINYDETVDDDVRLESSIDLTEAEWQTFLQSIDGAVWYKDTVETLDEDSRTAIEWESMGDEYIPCDSIHIEDQEKRAAFSAFRDEVEARIEPVGAKEASGANQPDEDLFPLNMYMMMRQSYCYRRDDLEASFYCCFDNLNIAPDLQEVAYEYLHRLNMDESVWERLQAAETRFNDPAVTNPEANNYISFDSFLQTYRLDSRVISAMRETAQQEYWGDNFSREYSIRVYNIDAESGEDIALTDVVKDLDALGKVAAAALREQEYYTDNWYYNDLLIAEEDLESELTALLHTQEKLSFGLSYYNLILILHEDVLLEGRGSYELKIPFADHPALFEPEYTKVPAIERQFIAELLTNHDNKVLLSNGREVNLRVDVDYAETAEGLPTGAYGVWIDDAGFDATEDGMLDMTPYYVRSWTGDEYLWIEATHMYSSNGKTLIIYKIDNGKPAKVGETESYNAFVGGLSGEEMLMEQSLWTIGTTGGLRSIYYIGEDGMPAWYTDEQGRPEYTVINAFPLTAKQSLTCEAYIDNGEGWLEETEDYTIAVGDVLQYYQTDGETYVDFHIGNGGLVVRIYYENVNGICTVNGVDVEELFEGIVWAG